MAKGDPNPGLGHTLKAAFANADATWEEEVDLNELLATAVSEVGHECRSDGDRLSLPLHELALKPQFVSFEPKHPKGAKICSTIEFGHQSFGTTRPFEYQHAMGNSLAEAFTDGFKSWATFDLPVILDALREKPVDCAKMEMSWPVDETTGSILKRRAVLGAAAHLVQKRDLPSNSDHDFCPCCLLTNSLKAFDALLKADAFYGIRLFAARHENGSAEADCRVNGQDFEEGRAALVAYAETWPDRGLEYRKQYVILQTIAPAANST